MKNIKLENKIAYFMLTFSIFILNFKYLSFISILFGTFISLFAILLIDYFRLYKYKTTKILLFIISIPIFIYSINKISYFIGDNILKEYSIIIITISLLTSIFLIGNKGYHTIIKIIILSSYFLFFIFILGIILTFIYIKPNYLTINLLVGDNIFLKTIFYVLSQVYCYFLIYPITKTKFLKKDILISSVFQIIIYLFIYSILGILTIYLKYPYVTIFKKVSLFYFIERIEIIFSLNYLFYFYYFLLLIYFQLKTIICLNVKKKKQQILILLFLVIILFLSSMMF